MTFFSGVTVIRFAALQTDILCAYKQTMTIFHGIVVERIKIDLDKIPVGTKSR